MKLMKKLYLLWFMRIANLITGVVLLLLAGYYLVAVISGGGDKLVYVTVLIFLVISCSCFFAFFRLKKAIEQEKAR